MEEQIGSLSQSLHSFLGTVQEASTSKFLAGSAGTDSASEACRGMNTNDSAEEHVVLSLGCFPYWENVSPDICHVATFTLTIGPERTNVSIQCLTTPTTNCVTVSAKLIEPGKWCLPSIEPLPSLDVCSSSLAAYVYQEIKQQAQDIRTIPSDYVLRCTCGIPKPVSTAAALRKTCLKFLIRRKRCNLKKS